ncbi:copper(I)-binding protein [Rhodopseudomonas julia]|uniref:Copper(I)-binding protein n=1 Tax=Rhodopseudomonas julia TaxID=200617 RepID=A0ABU0CAE8_9BRAD|nr:copper chaperone PCu(A)C [Rhodopseudomonas julia]MDQ0327508.1 copper(I)-binding protein [Rhodopseudomonas julia]
MMPLSHSFRSLIATGLAAGLIAGGGSAFAQGAGPIKVGDLTISDAWTRATPPGAPSAGGYLTISNAGSKPDRLVSVSAPFAEESAVHAMSMQDGVMRMRAMSEGLEIRPGESVTLEPGGNHVMFMGLETTLTAGKAVPVTLTFEHAGKVELDLPTAAIGATHPPEASK